MTEAAGGGRGQLLLGVEESISIRTSAKCCNLLLCPSVGGERKGNLDFSAPPYPSQS